MEVLVAIALAALIISITVERVTVFRKFEDKLLSAREKCYYNQLLRREQVERGDLVRDKITGFEGIVVIVVNYAFNENRVGLKKQQLDSDGKPPDAQFFDSSMCEIVKERVVDPAPIQPVAFKLLDEVRDSITGYQGKLIAFSLHISGCIRAGVQSDSFTRDTNLPVEEQWFPASQLELVKKTEYEPRKKTGGPMRTPGGVKNPR